MRQFTIKNAAAVALVAATAKTVLYLKAGANLPLDVSEWWTEFDGTSGSAVPVLVELLRFTTDCTVTSATPTSKGSILNAATAYFTGGSNASVEGTAGDVLYRHNVPPTAGKHVMFPLGDEIQVGKGERLGIRITAPAGVNVLAGFGVRE